MDPVFAKLLTEGIGLARDVLSFFRPRLNETVANPPAVPKPTPDLTVQSHEAERSIDKATLQKIIAQTNRQFERLLESQTQEILTELRANRIRDAVHEVQARVVALKSLLNAPPADPQIAMQLVLSALNPLQVSLEVARFRLQDAGEHEAWRYCYLVGSSALIAGYVFIHQDAAHLTLELQNAMYDTQRTIMNAAAENVIARKGEIPWDQVPRLLSPEGANDLLQFYETVVGDGSAVSSSAAVNISTLNVAEARVAIAKVTDRAPLKKMLSDERRSKARHSVIVAIQQRLQQLK